MTIPPTSLDGWQDIATAPKDGRCILVADADDSGQEPGVMSWVDTSREEEVFVRETKAGSLYKTVRIEDGYWSGSSEIYDPTHWQPLPAPPTREPGGGE